MFGSIMMLTAILTLNCTVLSAAHQCTYIHNTHKHSYVYLLHIHTCIYIHLYINICHAGDGTLDLGTGVTYLGESAFYNNALLKGSLIIPSSVTEIGKQAFYYFIFLVQLPNWVEVHFNFVFHSLDLR